MNRSRNWGGILVLYILDLELDTWASGRRPRSSNPAQASLAVFAAPHGRPIHLLRQATRLGTEDRWQDDGGETSKTLGKKKQIVASEAVLVPCRPPRRHQCGLVTPTPPAKTAQWTGKIRV